MKKTLSCFLYTMLTLCIVCACSDSLDITHQNDLLHIKDTNPTVYWITSDGYNRNQINIIIPCV